MKNINLMPLFFIATLTFSTNTLADITVKNNCKVTTSAGYVALTSESLFNSCRLPWPTKLIPPGGQTTITTDKTCSDYSVWISYWVGVSGKCQHLSNDAVVQFNKDPLDICSACDVVTP